NRMRFMCCVTNALAVEARCGRSSGEQPVDYRQGPTIMKRQRRNSATGRKNLKQFRRDLFEDDAEERALLDRAVVAAVLADLAVVTKHEVGVGANAVMLVAARWRNGPRALLKILLGEL